MTIRLAIHILLLSDCGKKYRSTYEVGYFFAKCNQQNQNGFFLHFDLKFII